MASNIGFSWLRRRRGLLGLGAALLMQIGTSTPAAWAQAAAAPDAAWRALQAGAILLLRHANAPGTGDPPGFKLDDCTTQRNLDADGQAQALRIAKAFAAHGVTVGAVWSSAWCRAKETGELAFPGRLRVEPAFNSFFDSSEREPTQTATERELLLGWRGPGALVVVTHQANITALTGVNPRSGEGIVLQPRDGRLVQVGRIAF